jgi:hypothetical protein
MQNFLQSFHPFGIEKSRATNVTCETVKLAPRGNNSEGDVLSLPKQVK